MSLNLEIEPVDFSKAQMNWSGDFKVAGQVVPCEQIVAALKPRLTDERRARLDQVIAARSLQVVSVLENIYDRGNVSAVMRSSEAFGFFQMHLVDKPGAKFKAANRVTRGAEKWLDIRNGGDPVSAVKDLQKAGFQVWATDLSTDVTIDSVPWDRPVAVVFGNEKEGISPEMRSAVNGCFRIPMAGFSQSFNISVAAALVFYYAHLQHRKLNLKSIRLNHEKQQMVLANCLLRSFDNPDLLIERYLLDRRNGAS